VVGLGESLAGGPVRGLEVSRRMSNNANNANAKAVLLGCLDPVIQDFDDPDFAELRDWLNEAEGPHTSAHEAETSIHASPAVPEPEPAFETAADLGQTAEPDDSQLWYERDKGLLVKTVNDLEPWLRPLPGRAHLFYRRKTSGILGAEGLAQVRSDIWVRLDIVFDPNHPHLPPRCFFYGRAVHLVAGRLRSDGSIPVPAGGEQQWTPATDSVVIVRLAVEWLQRNFNLRRE